MRGQGQSCKNKDEIDIPGSAFIKHFTLLADIFKLHDFIGFVACLIVKANGFFLCIHVFNSSVLS